MTLPTSDQVREAIAALPWRQQRCPSMPHEYAIIGKSPRWAVDVLTEMVSPRNPKSYRAYFRGYQDATRYWDEGTPDGLRYWRGGFEIDRCDPSSVEPLRRVQDGAKAIKDWAGPRHAPNGSGLYELDALGRWLPAAAAIASGYQPCDWCLPKLRANAKRAEAAERAAAAANRR